MDQESNPWRENHGTAILVFALVQCLIGSLILGWKQTHPHPNTPTLQSSEVAQSKDDSEELAKEYSARGVRPLELRIYGAASDGGVMKIAIYTTPESFNKPEKAADLDNWQIEDGICTGIWELPLDVTQFAFAVYHDENGNGQLDLNPVGFPIERYGFSNNARGLVGPPNYEQAQIDASEKVVEISIR